MLTPLTIFDIDLKVAPHKPLQVIWWHRDVESISRSKDCVLKRVGVITNYSNDIPLGSKVCARTNRTVTDDGDK